MHVCTPGDRFFVAKMRKERGINEILLLYITFIRWLIRTRNSM